MLLSHMFKPIGVRVFVRWVIDLYTVESQTDQRVEMFDVVIDGRVRQECQTTRVVNQFYGPLRQKINLGNISRSAVADISFERFFVSLYVLLNVHRLGDMRPSDYRPLSLLLDILIGNIHTHSIQFLHDLSAARRTPALEL